MKNQLNNRADLMATSISFKNLVKEVSDKGAENVDAVAVGTLSDLQHNALWSDVSKKFSEPFAGVVDSGLVGYASKNMKVIFLRYSDGQLRSVALASGYNKKIKAFVVSLRDGGVTTVETIDQLNQASWKQVLLVVIVTAILAFFIF
jgi:hypothetical protein